MRLGVFCIVVGVTSLVITVWMMMSGATFIRGFVVFIALSLFGLHLIRKAKRKQLEAIKQWAKENPEEARQWLNACEEADDAGK